jgi:predicted nuclease of restriction endonuclease-like (RecB) superfamily
MLKKPAKAIPPIPGNLDENYLFSRIAAIIEKRKNRMSARISNETVMMFWEIGNFINTTILGDSRAEYGKQIFPTLSGKLTLKYGNSFNKNNLYRMSHFADLFSEKSKIAKLSEKLSWSHFSEIIQVKKEQARIFYACYAAEQQIGVRELRHIISRKAYERKEIANTRLSEKSRIPQNIFKDPYFLDVFGLKDNYLEADLEQAILRDLENFILEFGKGFSFVARQKKMEVGGDEFRLDLLFYHRTLKRLVAIELKIGKFRPQYKGQMEFYLKWLDKYERKEGENTPIGLILCTQANRAQIELLEMDKAGIAVAEYWTELPPKDELENKIMKILQEAKERLEKRKSLHKVETKKRIDYFIEESEDGDE